MTTNKEITDLHQSTSHSRYVDQPDETHVDLTTEELVTALELVFDGERSKVVGVRDPLFAALLAVLEENEVPLTGLGNQLQDVLNRDQTENLTKSDIVRLAIRVGLREGAPAYHEQLVEAKGEHAKRNY